jgi:hypothetical protein
VQTAARPQKATRTRPRLYRFRPARPGEPEPNASAYYHLNRPPLRRSCTTRIIAHKTPSPVRCEFPIPSHPIAAMFRDFSFEPASQHPQYRHEADRAAMNLSPTSMPRFAPPASPPTPPPCPVGELAARFDQHTLRVEVDPAYRFPLENEPLTPPDDDAAFPSESQLGKAPRPTYSRLSTATLRMQRQANMRWQCTAAHSKDISQLVQRMVEDEDQCCVSDAKPIIPAPNTTCGADQDEGLDMDYTPPSPPLYPLKFRRSGDRLTGGVCVSRNVRMRKSSSKESRVTKRSSR